MGIKMKKLIQLAQQSTRQDDGGYLIPDVIQVPKAGLLHAIARFLRKSSGWECHPADEFIVSAFKEAKLIKPGGEK